MKVLLSCLFQLIGHSLGFYQQTQKVELPLVQHSKQHHSKVQLKSFLVNGHTFGLDPQTQKLEPPSAA